MEKDNLIDFFKKRKFQWIIAIILFIFVLFISSSIRVSNWDILVDQTTGEKIPTALDPFYFVRMVEAIEANGGKVPDVDPLRYNPRYETPWHPEIMPKAIYYIYLISSPLGYSIREVSIFSPVIFFILSMIVFYILVYSFRKNKWTALLASTFLAFSPPYLYRSMAGFTDHEAIGMLFFFLAIFLFLISLRWITQEKKIIYSVLGGILTGLATLLSIVSWGGVSRFLFIVIPMGFFLTWLFNTKESKNFVKKGLIFYILWFFSTLLFTVFFRFAIIDVFKGFFMATQSLLSVGVLAFIIVDSALIYQKRIKLKEKYRIIYSFVGAGIVGLIGLVLMGKNLFAMIKDVISGLIKPLGHGRFGVTVAENQTPYVMDWISQTGPILFWLFILGIVLLGWQLGKNIKNLKRRIIFNGSYILMVFGIVFSKISQRNILNGDNFLSSVVYVLPLIFFWIYFIWLYLNEDFKFNSTEIVLFVWMFLTIILGRVSVRTFFAITPFVCFMGAYFVMNLINEYKTSKDETFKIVMLLVFALALIASGILIYNSYNTIANQAQYTGPSAHIQWQKSMEWVRENTPQDSVFAHWWDYGYWVQSLGQRRTIADGGHFQGEEGIHRIGRYVLTTPRNETALSYFKSMNVDYLLIDQTDLGKYPAYARIGSDDNWDRYTFIPVGLLNPSRTEETQNLTRTLYQFNGVVDEDIYYNLNGNPIFLPGPTFDNVGNPSFKAGIGGVILTSQQNMIAPPTGIFVYNGQRYDLPLRYLYANGQLHDFGVGIEAVAMIVPAVEQNQAGQQYINHAGGIIYLSPKVTQSLFAQLYLLNDAFGRYSTIELAHMEDDPLIASLRSQNYTNDFIIYNGFRGPIKIWNVQNIPDEVLHRPEFYAPHSWKYADLDDLEFTK
jgi:asparagine N-glycosylation enzyme membrane subunit Stt3